jgi:hypothetical protein
MLLFRRASEALRHIEDREWLLLLLETLGVLAGILIAFELQEWGQHRDEAAKHHQLMERLLEETENDVASMRFMRNALKPMVEKEQAFATQLGRGQCPPNDDFQAATTFGMMPALTPPSSVYEELMGAGGLSSIERKDVRSHLARFHENVEWSQKQIDFFRAVRVDPIPDSDPRVDVRFDPSRDEPQVVTLDGPTLCKDQTFRNEVATAAREHTVFLSYVEGPLEDAITSASGLATASAISACRRTAVR